MQSPFFCEMVLPRYTALSRLLLFVMLSTVVLMLLLLFITVLTFPIVWRCAYGFCTIAVDSVSLCHVFSTPEYIFG